MSDAPPAVQRNVAREVIGAIIGVGLLAFVLSRVDLAMVAGALTDASLAFLVAGWLLKLAPMPVRILRWYGALAATSSQRPRGVARSAIVGWFLNNVFPFELGTLARIRVFQRHNRIAFAPVVATLALERSLDLMTLLALIAAYWVMGSLPESLAGAVWPLFGVGLVFAAVLVWGLVSRGTWVPSGWREHPTGAFVHRVSSGFAEGLGAIRSGWTVAGLALLTGTVWMLEAGGMWCFLKAFHLSLSFPVALLLTVALALGLSVRTAPAGLGAHQVVSVGILALYGVAAETAVAVSLTVQALVVLSIAVLGAPLVWWESRVGRGALSGPGEDAC